MRITAISDLHGNLPDTIEDTDILLIVGDISPAIKMPVFWQERWLKDNFIGWCSDLISTNKTRYVVFCAGNHDFVLERIMTENKESEFKSSLPTNVIYLRDSHVNIEGLRIYGIPWSLPFYEWAFMKPDHRLDRIFDDIPDNMDIVISHGPMMGYADSNNCDTGLGSNALLHSMLKRRPRYLFSGHIHEASHIVKDLNEYTKVACVSLLDDSYKMAYEPLTIEMEPIQ